MPRGERWVGIGLMGVRRAFVSVFVCGEKEGCLGGREVMVWER